VAPGPAGRKWSERYRELYAVLGLGVTAHKDGAPTEEPSTIWECATGPGLDNSAFVGKFTRNRKGGVMSCDGSS
jgi:hypothetical protein